MSVPLSPTNYLRRSQLYRWHLAHGAHFTERAGSLLVSHYRPAEHSTAASLGLVDLSTHPRVGFKGADTVAWLWAQGIALPAQPNRATELSDHSLLARLSDQEHLLLPDIGINATRGTELAAALPSSDSSRTYLLPRADSHGWFALTGSQAAATMARLCGVDLRAHKFADYQVTQTSLARVNAIIIRQDVGSIPRFNILSDISTVEYLWDALLDAMQDAGGCAIGVEALLTASDNA